MLTVGDASVLLSVANSLDRRLRGESWRVETLTVGRRAKGWIPGCVIPLRAAAIDGHRLAPVTCFVHTTGAPCLNQILDRARIATDSQAGRRSPRTLASPCELPSAGSSSSVCRSTACPWRAGTTSMRFNMRSMRGKLRLGRLVKRKKRMLHCPKPADLAEGRRFEERREGGAPPLHRNTEKAPRAGGAVSPRGCTQPLR